MRVRSQVRADPLGLGGQVWRQDIHKYDHHFLMIFSNTWITCAFPAGKKDPGMSGNFEVYVVDGKLLHSKKKGAGFVDTDAKMDKIIEGVEEALAAQ